MIMQNEVISVPTTSGNLVCLPEMKVLGVLFDAQMSWIPQMNKAIKSCQRLKPALHYLNIRLSRDQFKKVITSHYYSRLYYASELWFPCLNKKFQKRICTLHYWPLQMLLFDFKYVLNRATIDFQSKRASPFQLNNFKVAKMLIKILNNATPYNLFHDVLSHAVTERRAEYRPKFLDMSRKRIGRQYFANRVSHVATKLNFDWCGVALSPLSIHAHLKASFFGYFI